MRNEIASKLEMLRGYVTILRGYQDRSLEDLKTDITLRGAVERYFELALECSLDIGEMIISMEKLKTPESYKDVIRILGEECILSKELAEKFEHAASFRNVLVHMYADINVEKVYSYLQNNLDDFDEFAKFIARHLEKKD